jgi:YegS/Rv2252/BmrU family lipid kinase
MMPHDAHTAAALATSDAPPARRLLVVYNPVAGRRRRRRFMAMMARLEALGCSVSLRETGGPGDATALARAAGPEDGDVLVAAGGDGTFNEVANGLVQSGRPGPLPLAIMPLGTSNVLAAEIGLRADPEAAALTVARGTARPISLGRIRRPGEDARIFLLMAGAGFDAHVVAGVGPVAKRLLGRFAYVGEAVRQVWRFGYPTYRVTIDGAAQDVSSVVVAKARRYGGPFVIAPKARIEDPSLQVCICERNRRDLLPRFVFGLFSGRLADVAGFRILTAHQVRIEGPEDDPVQCDGDVVTSLPVEIDVLEGAVSMIMPDPAAPD